MNDVLIIGGGPAGSAAAIALAKAGKQATLFERTTETGDAICGGFLSWQSLARLRELGIDEAQLGGHGVDRVRLFCQNRMVEAMLPQAGIGVSRQRLDTALIGAAEQAGADVRRGVKVHRVEQGVAILADGTSVSARDIFLATGKYGLPGHARPAPSRGAHDPVAGLRLRLPAHPDRQYLIGSAVELHLFDRGYIGMVQQEDGAINLCLAVHKSRLNQADRWPAKLISQWANASGALAVRLGSPADWGPVDAIANVPYGWRITAGTPGIWRLGDQAAVIPSLAGEGMGIALSSSISAAQAYLAGQGAQSWQLASARKLAMPMAVAGAARAIAEHPRWNIRALRMMQAAPWVISLLARLTRVPS